MADLVENIVTGTVATTSRIEPRERRLERFGVLVVGLLLLGGVLLGAASGFGLYWFVFFGGVGGVLAVLRPLTSIGWILLGIGASLVLVTTPINATVGDFAGNPPPGLAVAAFVTSAAAGAIFVLFALLAFVFPSGRLPTGRWGAVVRGLLVASTALQIAIAFAPTVTVNLPSSGTGTPVPNPFALVPTLAVWDEIASAGSVIVLVTFLVSAASLFTRLRRATGIESHQLRWVTSSVLLVSACLLFGLITPLVIGNAAQEEGAELPFVVALPTIPVAIGIAVMRYRLYDIDTIVNRVIVYGLLTAILAGVAAAATGLAQQVFSGIVGRGSELSTILTTVVVVAAFQPLKHRLDAMVNRRFKPAPDPDASLGQFTRDVRGSFVQPERDRVLRRLLEIAVDAFVAAGGRVGWSDATGEHVIDAGVLSGEEDMFVSATTSDERAALRLYGVKSLRPATTLESALAAAIVETRGGSTLPHTRSTRPG